MKKMKNNLENIEPLTGIGLQHYNILLLGVIGAGKSSFYNTVATVFENKVKDIAPTAEELSSVTNEVHAYDILNENGDKINIKLLDIRGYEEERGYEHELDLILDGKIADGYEFPDKSPARDDIIITNTNPTINDQVHLVCLIVDSTKFKIQSDKMVDQIDTIKKLIRRRGLPLVAVATKFDHLCPKISEDADHIYLSPKAKDETSAMSETFGIELRHIFPIVNYINDHEEITPGKNKLVIEALHSMMQITRDHLFHHRGALRDEDNSWSMRVKRLQVCRSNEHRENEIKDLCQEMSDDNTLRVLCYGPVNSGKSSFIDSIMSLLTGKIVSRATGGYSKANSNGTSKTEKFQMYQLKFKSEPGKTNTSNVFFCDMPGIQDKEGVKLEQAKLIVKGHVPNKFKIQNKSIDKDSKHFVKDAGSMCKIHCVCFLFDISNIETLTETFKETCKRFQWWLSNKDIPYVVVVTKGDQTSTAVRDNALQIYENKLIRENKDKLIEYFSFKESKIFPVRNYVHENQTLPEIDALLLDALKEIVSIGYEYLGDNSGDESVVSDSSTDDESSSDQE
ncbi:interferon-induced protein 44-like [Ruditapes philippinarum]|uniref:interferon-induced protein 44-like n=1 Tax=Ruditapes philippinarum TaxID=129788 RepID=UPI00295B9E39|nr:interferon-induced protein 44-like [Ruditapes philippinarum]